MLDAKDRSAPWIAIADAAAGPTGRLLWRSGTTTPETLCHYASYGC
jgi:hypothetical protein